MGEGLPSPWRPLGCCPGKGRRQWAGHSPLPIWSPHHTAQVKVCSGKLRDPSPHRGHRQGPGRLPPHGKGLDTWLGTTAPIGKGSQQTQESSGPRISGVAALATAPLPAQVQSQPLLGHVPGRGPSAIFLPGQGVWSRLADPRRASSPSATTTPLLITSRGLSPGT